MSPTPVPAVSGALPLNEALQQSAPLADLRRRMRDSTRCLEAIRPCLPPGLRPHVQAGPVDAEAWTLLAANAAVAAKLKQLRPRLEAELATAGCVTTVLRIRVLQAAPHT